MKLFLLALFVGGVVSFKTNARIVGGSNASIADYPWQGALLYSGNLTGGAVLISSNQVLTAAHLVHEREDPTRYTIRFGSSQYSTGGKVYNVTKITKHADYNANTDLNDIAALELAENAEGENIAPISRLDNRRYDYLHNNCTITGWGKTVGQGDDNPSTLQAASTACITKDECNLHWQGYGETIDDQQQCVLNGVSSACSGDSGGPLSCQDGGNTLVGLNSFGHFLCPVDVPSVYVRISYFCDWIRNNTGVSCPVSN